jgi:hypothetical protein
MPAPQDINPATGHEYARNPETGVWDDNYFARTYGGGGGGGDGRSTESIDLSQVPSVQEFVKGQFAGEDVALKELVNMMRSQEKPIDIYGRMESEMGLPELRGAARTLTKEIGSIEDILEGIEPSVAGRTRESIVTEAQRSRIVSAEREPHEKALAKLARGLGRITGSISELSSQLANKVNLIMQGQTQELEPAKLLYQVLVERNSRTLSGFTTDRQTQLDIMFDKLQRQRELSDQDWALTNKLASEEREYVRGLQSAAAQLGLDLTGGESVNELLGIIGEGFAEAIAYERTQDAKKNTSSFFDEEIETKPTYEPKPGVDYTPVDWSYYGLDITSPEQTPSAQSYEGF